MDITPKPLTIPLSIFFYNNSGIAHILSRNIWEISAVSDASMKSEWEVLATCDDGHINTSPLFPFGQNFPIPAFFEARLLANFFHIAPQSPHKRSSCLLVHPRLSFSFLAVLPTFIQVGKFPSSRGLQFFCFISSTTWRLTWSRNVFSIVILNMRVPVDKLSLHNFALCFLWQEGFHGLFV